MNKGHKKVNKSVDTSISRNTRVKGFLKWPANISWTQDSEAMFRLNAKNERRNQSMTAYDRNHVDSVRNLIEGEDNKRKDNYNNKGKKYMKKIWKMRIHHIIKIKENIMKSHKKY